MLVGEDTVGELDIELRIPLAVEVVCCLVEVEGVEPYTNTELELVDREVKKPMAVEVVAPEMEGDWLELLLLTAVPGKVELGGAEL